MDGNSSRLACYCGCERNVIPAKDPPILSGFGLDGPTQAWFAPPP